MLKESLMVVKILLMPLPKQSEIMKASQNRHCDLTAQKSTLLLWKFLIVTRDWKAATAQWLAQQPRSYSNAESPCLYSSGF